MEMMFDNNVQRWSTSTNWNDGDNGYALEIGETYHIELDATQGWFTTTVNGNVTFDEAVAEHTLYDSIPCWLSVCFLFISGSEL